MALVQLGLDTGNMAEAEAWLKEVDKEVKGLNSREHESEIYTLHYRMDNIKGLYREALRWYEKAQAMEDSIMDQDKNNRIHNIGISIERRRHGMILARTQSELKAEKSRSTFWLWGGVILLTVSVLTVGLMTYVQRIKAASMKALQEASRMREDFFTNITHEFRTPLTVILGLSGEMKEKSDNEEWRSKCEAIYRHGNSLLRLVTQLLDIAKIKSRVGEPDWRHGNIVAQVKMIAETFNDYAASRGIELAVEAQGNIDIDFVPDYINKVVSNLLSNSLKFTPSGGQITIKTASDGKQLTLAVTDTGKGMSEEEKNNIFKPFYSSATGNKGTGVGLALVKQIADSLEGKITVESTEGEGSTFTLTIPVRKAVKGVRKLNPANYDMAQAKTEAMAGLDNGNSTEADMQEDLQEGMQGNQQRKVVLVIEDNSDVAKYIGSQLSADYDVAYAVNGNDGLKKAISMIPDMIVSDLMMPEMDGLEMCSKIRANEEVNHIPVIMLTAKITEADKLKGLEAGVDAYLPKPFNADELRLRVAKLLEQRQVLRHKYSQAKAAGKDIKDITVVADDRQAMATMEMADAFLNKATDYIYAMLERYEVVSVSTLAEKLNMNARQLHRKLTAVADITPNTFIMNLRIRKAMKMIEDNKSIPLKNVAFDCGFSEYSHFTKSFKSIVGVPPSEYGREKKI